MTDPALVAKKLALIESCLSDLHRLAKPEALATDVREQRFVEHTLQVHGKSVLDSPPGRFLVPHGAARKSVGQGRAT